MVNAQRLVPSKSPVFIAKLRDLLPAKTVASSTKRHFQSSLIEVTNQ